MEVSLGSKFFVAGAPYRAKDFSGIANVDLCLRLSASPFQIEYLIAEKKSCRVLCLQPYQNTSGKNNLPEFLEAVLKEDAVLKEFTGDKCIGILTSSFSLLPKEFSDTRLAGEWKKQFAPDYDSTTLCVDEIKNLGLEVAYSVPASVFNLFRDSWKEFQLQHSISNQIHFLASGNQEDAIYCNVQAGLLEIIFFREKQLKFANIFPYQSPEDFIYFLLACYNHFHLDPESLKVVLLGQIVKESALFRLVYKYIRNIQFAYPPEQWKFDDDYPFPGHFYFSLFCQDPCA